MANHSKPFTIQFPLTARAAEDIDKMFRDLYNRIETLENATTGALQPAQVLSRQVVGQ